MTALTDILTAHRVSSDGDTLIYCHCGELEAHVNDWDDGGFQRWVAHVEAVIQEARMMLVELPEADEDGEWWGEIGWFVGRDSECEGFPIAAHLQRRHLSSNAARNFAAALLAAAFEAERAVVGGVPTHE